MEKFSEITSERCYFTPQIPKWDIQEVTVNGPQEGNPFTDHWIRGCFRGKSETVEAEGFYDGRGVTWFVSCPPLRENTGLRSGRISWRKRNEEAFRCFLPKREITGPFVWRIPGILLMRMERHTTRWEPPAMCGSFRTTPD